MSINLERQTPPQGPTDYLLIERAYAGDHAAFEILVRRYEKPLYHLIARYLGREKADDVLQFVLLQCYLTLPKLLSTSSEPQRDRSLKPWLFRVAQNRCLDEYRKSKCHPQIFFSELDVFDEDERSSPLLAIQDPASLPEEVAEQDDERERICAAIQTLPQKFRDIVWLRYTEDLTFLAIGRKLNIAPSAAKTYFYRARSQLRAALTAA
jgi:RNA polymerase sigma-70 factor (ECF subfamily)